MLDVWSFSQKIQLFTGPNGVEIRIRKLDCIKLSSGERACLLWKFAFDILIFNCTQIPTTTSGKHATTPTMIVSPSKLWLFLRW